MKGLRVIEPLGYLDFLALEVGARLVLTDSGGIQEETIVLGIPCLTLRNDTERPVTVSQGTNRLTGQDPTAIAVAVEEILNGLDSPASVPEYWDGHAAERIADVLDAGL